MNNGLHMVRIVSGTKHPDTIASDYSC